MPFAFDTLNEVSLIAAIDGADCKEDSLMGFWGLLIWIPFALYLMVGQFVICEEYFVPILAQLGDRWQMAEDVQGATLLAVGSSSPELFTAVLGVILYPDDNPGPGTNVGSAVFNMCIIIGLSAIFAPRSVKLAIVPFLRDSICYMIGLIELYYFYVDGYMDIWESILLTLWWMAYAFMVYRTDLLATRCCCCVPDKELDKVLSNQVEMKPLETIADDKEKGGTDYVALGGAEEDNDYLTSHKPSYQRSKSVVKTEHGGRRGVAYDDKGHPVADMEQNPDNIRIAPGAIPQDALDDELQNLLDELNRKQRQNVNKGWVVVVMPTREARNLGHNFSSSNDSGVERNDAVQLGGGGRGTQATSHAYVRRRTLMETIKHEKEVKAINERKRQESGHHGGGGDDDDEHGHSRGGAILHKMLIPWVFIFHKTLPEPEGQFASKYIYATIGMIVCWLGLLTFFVVDASTKIGECFSIPADLLGITLLAVGSSLPDCISSVIVARQAKIDMAVANAFGSNVFDVNLCVGFSFVLGSIAAAAQGKSTSILLGDDSDITTFKELIAAAAGFLVMLWIMMWCTVFRLERWIGYILLCGYVGYICVFTTLFVHDFDSENEEVVYEQEPTGDPTMEPTLVPTFAVTQ